MVVISVLWLVRFSFHPDDQAALIVGNIWLVGANLSRHK
jgi:hypothetical protein